MPSGSKGRVAVFGFALRSQQAEKRLMQAIINFAVGKWRLFGHR